MSDCLLSCREGAAVTPAAPRRLEVEGVTREATRLRPWCRASPAEPSALASR